jgi:predicted enzyme related to lactoylglutathione lyase
MTANSNYIRAAGIGVSDPAASKKFYVDSVGLEPRSPQETAIGQDLTLADARGNVLLLTSYAREHNYKKNPVKIVFAVPDADAFYARLLAGGGRKHTPPQKFGTMYLTMAFDPDGYVVEGIQMDGVTSPLFVAIGIGVSNLDTAAAYYTGSLGLKFVRDIAVPGYMNEKELASSSKRGLGLVLMNYEDTRVRYENVPSRLVLAVDDAEALTGSVASADASKVVSAAKVAGDGGAAGFVLRDHDGYLIELSQAQLASAAS